MDNNNWVTFWFESNQSFGLCKSKEDWERIKSKYLEYWEIHGGLDLTKCMSTKIPRGANHPGSEVYNFGFRIEHNVDYSLADFAKDNNMDL